MPRAKNPIADLAAHRDKLAELNEKQVDLERGAAEFLGSLMLKAGLDRWDDKALRSAISRLGKLGEEKGIIALSHAQLKRPAETGAKAAISAAE